MGDQRRRGAVVGYARVSTAEQTSGLSGQVAELEAAGCVRVFAEKVSSVDAHRPELKAALDWLREGDTFVVTKPDRLARSVADLLRIVKDLSERRVAIRILSMQVDTTTPTGLLTLQVLGAVAEFERGIMLERQRHGIQRAKAEGRYKGRAPTARAHVAQIKSLHLGGAKVGEIVKATGVSRASVYRLIREAPEGSLKA